MTISRNPDGFSTVLQGERFSAFPYPLPFDKYAQFGTDFTDFVSTTGSPNWTLTETNGTLAVTGPGGIVTLTLGGADNDLAQFYVSSAHFQMTSGKRAFFRARASIDAGAGGTIGSEEVFIGMSSVQTGANFFAADGSARTMDDAIGFASVDGTANVDCIMGENDSYGTETAATTYADETYYIWGIDFDGTTASFYRDDVLVGELTTVQPTSVLTPMLYVKAGEAAAKVLSCDYIWFAVER